MSGALTGRKIVITRAAHQYAELADLVRAEDGEPLAYPTIAIAPPEDTRALDGVLSAAVSGSFDWVVITSANTAISLASRLKAIGGTLANVQIAAVGRSTAAAIKTYLHRVPALTPQVQKSAALVDAFLNVRGARILVPQSELADGAITAALTERGAQVTSTLAYRVVQGSGGVDLAHRIVSNASSYTLTFTSGSTIGFFLKRFLQEGGTPNDLHNVTLAVMGESAERALHEHGFIPTIRAFENTLTSLIEAIKDQVYVA